MSKYTFPISGDGRPVFTSNGIRVLFASGCTTQVSLLQPEVLKEKFGAELILDNVKMDPYFQVGECVGAIYKLNHFPFDGSEHDYSGLYVFNVVPSEKYKKACEDPNIDTVGAICDIIVSMNLFDGFRKDFENWTLNIPDDIQKAVDNANAPLQAIIDELKK